MENCQASGNNVTPGQINNFTGGFEVNGTSIIISNCTANNNTGGNFAYGFGTDTGSGGDGLDFSLINSFASYNGNYGFYTGIFEFGDDPVQELLIDNCTFNGNGVNLQDAAGIIVFQGAQRNSKNVVIKDCQISDTVGGTGLAAGISVTNVDNVVIENCKIFDTASTSLTGYGVFFNNVTNC